VNAARTRAAQLRGVFVGAISGVTAVAGHGFGGAHLPGSAAVVLVVLCSAVIGAVAAAVATRRVPVVIACLAIGQVLGHYLLGLVGEHAHTAQWSPAMVAAHLGAALVAAALICTAEGLFGAVATAVWRLVLVLIALRDSAQRHPTPSHWGVPSLAVRARAGCGRVTRGPPSFAA
jgi:hypothetical protein